MQRLDPSGRYADADVLAALQFSAGTRAISYRFDKLGPDNAYLGPLSNVLKASVANNMLADIKRTAKFTLLDDGSVDYLKHRIMPWARLRMPDGGYVEWPQGVFLLSTPKRSLSSGVYTSRDVEAYDQLQVLTDDKTSDRYSLTTGTFYTDALASIAAAEGLKASIVPSSLTLPAALEWEPGTSWLRVMNDILSAINYDSAWFDETGRLICRPYQSPSVRAAEYAYATDATSVIGRDVDQTLDLFGVPNKWIISVSEPDRTPLVSSYTNTSPSSPTSTVSRGRTIVDFSTGDEAADQATLDALVQRKAFDASQVYEVIEFKTAAMPFHSNADVYTLRIDDLSINAKYSEHEWSLDLVAGSMMSHTARRIVNV